MDKIKFSEYWDYINNKISGFRFKPKKINSPSINSIKNYFRFYIFGIVYFSLGYPFKRIQTYLQTKRRPRRFKLMKNMFKGGLPYAVHSFTICTLMTFPNMFILYPLLYPLEALQIRTMSALKNPIDLKGIKDFVKANLFYYKGFPCLLGKNFCYFMYFYTHKLGFYSLLPLIFVVPFDNVRRNYLVRYPLPVIQESGKRKLRSFVDVYYELKIEGGYRRLFRGLWAYPSLYCAVLMKFLCPN